MTSQGEAASRAEADRLKLELQELKEKEDEQGWMCSHALSPSLATNWDASWLIEATCRRLLLNLYAIPTRFFK